MKILSFGGEKRERVRAAFVGDESRTARSLRRGGRSGCGLRGRSAGRCANILLIYIIPLNFAYFNKNFKYFRKTY